MLRILLVVFYWYMRIVIVINAVLFVHIFYNTFNNPKTHIGVIFLDH